ncbi:unnamed protein product [Paramecium octaurelia]|uniref:Uncharacterized protein n=1 Tax=Paramecium octaurelia TaxID=43137 RepID=A0A8S1U9L3_PAROT|nr:unnamed protein product [Paramecium octaurelia]
MVVPGEHKVLQTWQEEVEIRVHFVLNPQIHFQVTSSNLLKFVSIFTQDNYLFYVR